MTLQHFRAGIFRLVHALQPVMGIVKTWELCSSQLTYEDLVFLILFPQDITNITSLHLQQFFIMHSYMCGTEKYYDKQPEILCRQFYDAK